MLKISFVILLFLLSFITLSASVIHEMITADDLDGISKELALHPELLEEVDAGSLSPLNFAVCNVKPEAVQLLLSLGADIHSGDREGSQPLINAAASGNLEITRYLLEHGAEIDRTDDNQATALSFALARRQPEIARYLLENGADPNLAGMREMPGLFYPVMNGDLELTRLMIEHGAIVDNALASGVTPLVSACTRGYLDIAEYLMEHGADVNKIDDHGQTPIFWAALRGQKETVAFLIAHGADLSLVNINGESVIFRATGDLETLKLLQDAGGDIHKLNNSGSNMLINTIWNGTPEVIAYLAQSLDVNQLNEYGTSGFYFAVAQDSLEKMQVFLEHGADPEFGSSKEWEPHVTQTAVHLAANNGSLAAIQLLEKYGADLNRTDLQRDRTPLHYAAAGGHLELLDYLITKTKDLNVYDNWNYTPLDYTRKYGFTSLENKLIAAGAESKQVFPEISNVAAGQCQIYYTGHSGWVLETENRILIFDYWENMPPNDQSSLKNGYLTRAYLENNKPVSFFVSHIHEDHYDPVIFNFADLDNVTYYFGFNPNREEEITLLTPREPLLNEGLNIYPIYSNDSGVGFLVETDGLVVFHAGDHANRLRDLSGDYLPEIEYLVSLNKPVDLAFMPIRGCNFGDDEAVRIGVYTTIDLLQPQYFIPMHSGTRESHLADFNRALTEAGYNLKKFAALDKGDRFLYSD
ncbi:MAG: ankyrin repeat domain-containing protein [Candidatus Cloacimonetes bacterium]|nr:ankyrin repeat domain-containing protein [Candidatus Cloacimonadota bacterium]